jgi:RNA polymerase sigma-70 factor (ECF subfamily)
MSIAWGGESLAEASPSFRAQFTALFDAHFRRLYASVHRISGESDLAADIAQDAFIRLYRRGTMPNAPEAWLISVALNLLRNAKTTRSRRLRLLTREHAAADQAPSLSLVDAADTEDTRRRVRATMDSLTERDRQLLVLRADGYGYRDIAAALHVNEASVGVLLARARRAFTAHYKDTTDASG